MVTNTVRPNRLGMLPCWLSLVCLACAPNRAPSAQEPRASEATYVVVSLASEQGEFERVAQHLSERHQCTLLRATPEQLEGLRASLIDCKPDCVGFVVEPTDLDTNLANRLMELATQMDDDPFADFAYGVITGRDANAAIRLIDAATNQPSPSPTMAQFGVAPAAMKTSLHQKAQWPLRKGSIPIEVFTSAGETDPTRDTKFISESMKKLEGHPILLFASHGYPDGLVGGPKATDIRDRNYQGSVAFNIACYTGVTHGWYEDDWQTQQTRRREVDSTDSFCLQMIDNGVASYISYLCPRPAGPTMMGEAMLIASTGQTIGELRREEANSIVLAHLMSGTESLPRIPFRDGDPLNQKIKPGESVRRWSTGGLLFGDPAFQPFVAKPNSDPRQQTITRHEGKITVDTQVSTMLFHFYCADQLNYWNDAEPAFRLEAVVPLEDHQVSQVRITQSTLDRKKSRLVAAIDNDHGQRALRIKANFAQPPMAELQKIAGTGLSCQFEIALSNQPPTPESDRRIFRGEGEG